MKLASLWFVLVCCAVTCFADSTGSGTNSPTVAAATNAATNPDTTTDTNILVAPTHLNHEFTNSADMELVQISGALWAGRYEVTQKEYMKVMGANPSAFSGNSFPVDSVGWDDAVLFCQKMTDLDVQKKAIPDGYHYDLPTEAEWTSFVGDATTSSAVTSLNGNFRAGTSQVGSLAPNNLGLYDVLGNVMEFVHTDESKPFRVLKGGSWKDFVSVNLRPEFRWYCKPDEKQNNFGFRCVLRAK